MHIIGMLEPTVVCTSQTSCVNHIQIRKDVLVIALLTTSQTFPILAPSTLCVTKARVQNETFKHNNVRAAN